MIFCNECDTSILMQHLCQIQAHLQTDKPTSCATHLQPMFFFRKHRLYDVGCLRFRLEFTRWSQRAPFIPWGIDRFIAAFLGSWRVSQFCFETVFEFAVQGCICKSHKVKSSKLLYCMQSCKVRVSKTNKSKTGKFSLIFCQDGEIHFDVLGLIGQ